MDENTTAGSELVILDVGRQRRRAFEELRQGIGPLAEEVQAAADAAVAQQGPGRRKVVPIVILYRKRRRKQSSGLLSGLLRAL